MTALADAGVSILKMDVTDETSMVDGVEQIVDETGRIDVLVNNAGYGSYGALEDVPMSEAKYQFEVNVFGLARLTQLVLPHMRAQGSGYICNVSSVGGKIYEPLGALVPRDEVRRRGAQRLAAAASLRRSGSMWS